MRVVALVALAGLVALVAALLTGSTPIAIVVIALAALGIVLLLRDWRSERRAPVPSGPPKESRPVVGVTVEAPLRADGFSPDISDLQDGPSSDARAD